MCSHTARQPHKSTLVLLRCFKRKSLRQPLPSSALVGKTSLTLSGIVVCAVPVAVLSSVAVFFIRIPVDAAISAIMSAELAFGELTNLDLFLLHLHSLLSIVYKVKKNADRIVILPFFALSWMRSSTSRDYLIKEQQCPVIIYF